MRVLLFTGVILLLLGLTLLFVPIPHSVRHGFTAGSVSVGVTTTERERVHPGISAVLIVAGVALMIAGRKR